MQELMQRLCAAWGVSGFEDEIRDVIRHELAGLVDEVRVDALGNLIALRKRGAAGDGGGNGQGRRVMIAAHMDQIGLMVTHVDEKGFIRFTPLGFVYPLASWGAQVRFADGTAGTIGLDGKVNPRSTLPEHRDMYIDVGASGKYGVKAKLGDVAAFWPGFVAQGDTWLSPNLDDRAGCLALIQFLKETSGQPLPHDIYAVFTTQEELGTRGAGPAGFAVEPEVALALDVTRTGDTPYAQAMEVALGKGAAIKVQDGGMIGHAGLNRQLIAAAEADGIPYQLEVLLAGTTDAYAIQTSRAGVPATALSIPSRHVHTPSQIVNAGDVAAVVGLLKAFLRRPIAL